MSSNILNIYYLQVIFIYKVSNSLTQNPIYVIMVRGRRIITVCNINFYSSILLFHFFFNVCVKYSVNCGVIAHNKIKFNLFIGILSHADTFHLRQFICLFTSHVDVVTIDTNFVFCKFSSK